VFTSSLGSSLNECPVNQHQQLHTVHQSDEDDDDHDDGKDDYGKEDKGDVVMIRMTMIMTSRMMTIMIRITMSSR